jgi:Beta-lactamase
LEAQKLLSRANYEQMWTPVRLNGGTTAPYGFGWRIAKTDSGHRMIEHGGNWQGFASYIVRYPDDRLTVAALCNRSGARAGYIAKRIAGFYVPALAPRLHTAVKLDPATLSSCAGDYRLEDRFTIKVSAADSRLETTWLGEKVVLIPESETAFFEEDSDRTYRFVKNGDGKVTSLIISVPEELMLHKLP